MLTSATKIHITHPSKRKRITANSAFKEIFKHILRFSQPPKVRIYDKKGR
jgi:hypothetical protein